MTWRICDIEITRPLEPVTLDSGEIGLALIVRRHSRPLGFLLREASGIVPQETIGQWITDELRTKIVEETLLDELGRPAAAPFPHPTLTAAICTRARPDSLERCLHSLLALRVGKNFEILVVDNAPPDDQTARLVATLPEVRYVVEPRAGLDFARNRAWSEAAGDWIAYLDDDVTVDDGWLAGWMETWSENPDAVAVTGLVLPMELTTKAQLIFEKRGGFQRGFEPRRFGQVLPGNPTHPSGAGLYGTGANMAFRRDILAGLGGFDEALDTGTPLPGGGDLDMFFRVLRAGHPLIYEPRFLVFHQHRRTITELQSQFYSWGLGFAAYVQKSRRADPSSRPLFTRLLKWWIHNHLHQMKESLRGRNPVPPAMLLAELAGALVGWMGEYDRSVRRIEKIRSSTS